MGSFNGSSFKILTTWYFFTLLEHWNLICNRVDHDYNIEFILHNWLEDSRLVSDKAKSVQCLKKVKHCAGMDYNYSCSDFTA